MVYIWCNCFIYPFISSEIRYLAAEIPKQSWRTHHGQNTLFSIWWKVTPTDIFRTLSDNCVVVDCWKVNKQINHGNIVFWSRLTVSWSGDRAVAILKMMSVSDATYKSKLPTKQKLETVVTMFPIPTLVFTPAWPLHQQHTFLMSPAAGSLALLSVQQAVYNV